MSSAYDGPSAPASFRLHESTTPPVGSLIAGLPVIFGAVRRDAYSVRTTIPSVRRPRVHMITDRCCRRQFGVTRLEVIAA
jgi:hypothetical protein